MTKEEMQEKINSNGEDITAVQIIEDFGTNLSYNQVMDNIDLFSEENQKRIREEIHRKQQEFWDDPENVEYYKKYHSNAPVITDHYELLAKIIEPKNGEVIVDLCCGTGNLIKRVVKNKNDFKLIGIDYSQRSLDSIDEMIPQEEKGKVELKTYDAKEGIPLEDDSIDKLISNWGIVYLEKDDLSKTLREVYRVLKPGGTFFLASLVKGGQKVQFEDPIIFLKLISVIVQKPVHIIRGLSFEKKCKKYFREYKVEELEELLTGSGFKILEKEFTIGGNKKGKSILFIAKK